MCYAGKADWASIRAASPAACDKKVCKPLAIDAEKFANLRCLCKFEQIRASFANSPVQNGLGGFRVFGPDLLNHQPGHPRQPVRALP
jgi:hypothetical protein